VILGDNFFEDDLKAKLVDIPTDRACVFLKDHADWHRFGVAEIKGDRIVRIVEKPTSYISPYVVTGFYALTNVVFDIIPTLQISDRGEYEIADILNWYARNGSLSYRILDGFWSDMGLHQSRNRTEKFLEEKAKEKQMQVSQ